jgi:hypothetical protein
MLSPVGPIAVAPDGDVYVSQPGEFDIKVFDTQGHLVRTIGHLGDGPGGFQTIMEIGFLGDTLYAVDLALGRVSLFTTSGEVLATLETVPRGLGGMFRPVPPLELCPGGTAIATPGVFNGIPVAAVPRVPYLRIDRRGNILDTLAWRRRAHPSMILHGRGIITTGQPFSDGSIVAVTRDGSRVAVVDRTEPGRASDATYRVSVLTSSRDTVYSRLYTYTPVPMEGAWVDSTVVSLAHRVRPIFTSAQEAQDTVRKAMFVPKYALAVSRALYSDAGELWIEREDIPGRSETWIALDSSGTPLAHVTLPAGLEVRLVGKDALWGSLTDSLGVPYVVRYTIAR